MLKSFIKKILLEKEDKKMAEENINLRELKSFRLKLWDKCNNNCIFCNCLTIKGGYEKNLDEIKKELNRLKNRNYKHIILPCNSDIMSDFFEIIQYIKRRGFHITLETNGGMFYYKDFVKKVVKYVDKFNVFINGVKGTHNRICNTNSFDKIIKGLNNLLELKADVQINTVITNYNYKNLNGIISLVKELGIKDIRLIFPVLKEKNKHIPEIRDCYQYIDEAIKFAKNSSLNIITGELFYNPFIPEDLNLDYGTAELKYEMHINNLRPSIMMPNAVRFELSSMCQLKCPICSTGRGNNKKNIIGWGYLKFKYFKRFVDENSYIKNIEVSNWGEIFLNPDLKQILKYAYKKNIHLSAGNGVNLNTVNKQVIECLVKYKFRFITVSIDGASNETYNIYRKGGDFNKVINNIKLINHYKKKHNARFPKLTWQFVIFGHNEHELPIARNMARNLGMIFKPKFNWSSLYSPVKNEKFVRKESGYGVTSREEFMQKNKSAYVLLCSELWFRPQINWDGKLLGCCSNIFSDFGNIFELGLKKCLEGEKYSYTKRMLLGEVKTREDIPCSKCSWYINKIPQRYLLKKLKYKSKFQNYSDEIQENPNKKISIIIPAYNRKNYLELTLKSLFNQDYPKDKYEIIVVDDGSNDGTYDMIKKLKSTCNLKYIYWPRNKLYKFGEPGNRAGPARNLGIRYAKGNILLFWDSDMIAEKNLLKEHYKLHRNKDNLLVIGNRIRLEKHNRMFAKNFDIKKAKKSQDKRLKKYIKLSKGNFNKIKNPWRIVVSNNLSIKKNQLDKFFDENFIFWGFEDVELGFRCFTKGLSLVYNNNAIGYHIYHKNEYGTTINRILSLQRNAAIFYKKHLDRQIAEVYSNRLDLTDNTVHRKLHVLIATILRSWFKSD